MLPRWIRTSLPLASKNTDHASSRRHGDGAQAPALLQRYDVMAVKSARQVIGTYSTSFSMATNVLAPRMRADIRNLYAMVRIADEIVDGSAAQAGVPAAEIAQLLEDYERAVLQAPHQRFHVDPVLHAYADTARRCQFDPEHVRSFFHSMRMDLTESTHSAESLDEYIFGSAEVIGLMCLSVFLEGRGDVGQEDRDTMTRGARALGAAFQKINFLRDYAEDSQELGRIYFPEILDQGLNEQSKKLLVADIRQDLELAHCTIPLLPLGARAGVLAATGLFEALTDKIDRTSAAEVREGRISVSDAHKTAIALRSVARAATMRQTTAHA